MSFRQLLANAAPDQETVITLGVFDGVHLGHCHLLSRLVQLSRPHFSPAVLTFSNHPITVLKPGTKVGYLTSTEHKNRLLKAQGLDLVISLEFTREIAQLSADNFTSILCDDLQMKGLVMGPDTAVGHNREGDFDYLQRRGKELGFWVEKVEPLVVDGVTIKSRLIRKEVSDGDVAAAARMLNRNYSLSGEVVLGDQRGQQLGFPTANLKVDGSMMLPGDGIYATWAVIDGVRWLSATSIGVRPTFGLSERLVEVHVMDFDADIYGENVCVEFVSKLRDQETFANVDRLIEQINEDVADSRTVLAQDRGSQVA